MKKPTAHEGAASLLIDQRIKDLGDWRGKMLAHVRKLIKQADPEVIEEWKWRGVPCWSHDGLICTGESYKSVVKATFAKGAALADPARLFNSSLEGNVRRAIDFHEGDKVNDAAFIKLIREAVALNLAKKPKSKKGVAQKLVTQQSDAQSVLKKSVSKKSVSKKSVSKKGAAVRP